MARIRSIKPEFWDDRKLAKRTSRDARLLYIALWNMADEHARLNGDPRWIRGQVFAYEDDMDDAAVAGLLAELEQSRVVFSYEDDGDPYLYLPNLGKHQRLEPGKVASRLPAPPQADDQQEQARANSSAPRADSSELNADKPALLYVAGSMEHVAGSRGAARGPERAAPRASPPPASGALHEIPGDFAPTGAMRRWANAEYPGLNLDEETAQFCRHFRAEGRRKKSWPDAWQKWIADSHKRMSQQQRRGGSPRQQETDELFGAAMQRAKAREESGNDPHRDGNAGPVHQGALPPAADRLLHPRRLARSPRPPRTRRLPPRRSRLRPPQAVRRPGRDHRRAGRARSRGQAAQQRLPRQHPPRLRVVLVLLHLPQARRHREAAAGHRACRSCHQRTPPDQRGRPAAADMTGLGCHMCGDLSHWHELCPWLQPAADLAEHQRRIQVYIDRMAENLISVAMKREFVKSEYEMWNSRKRTVNT